MKIALCFSGGIRNLEENFDSIKKCLIDPLNPDIFIHGWYFKFNELINHHKIYKKEETNREKVIELLKPKKYLLENYDNNKENFMRNIFKIDEIQNKYNNEYLKQLYPNTCGMLWSIYQSNLLKKQYEDEFNFKYDIVIRCRPDFIYYTPLNLKTLSLIKNNKTIILPLDNYAFVTQKCDKFAIGSSEMMDYYSSIILKMLEYEKKYPKDFWDGPNIIKKHLELFNTKIFWIYYDYDYKIRRKSQRLTKDKLDKLKYDSESYLVLEPLKYNFS